MIKKSLRNTISINIGAFVLVYILELLSGWTFKHRYDTVFSYYLWGLSFTIPIMVVIWINHFILIPYLLDKKRYFFYVFLLIGSLFFGAYLKNYANVNWPDIAKMFSYLIYSTGTGMAAFFLRRNMITQRENAEKEKLQKEMELNYLKEQVNPHFLFNSLNSIYSLSRQQSQETPDLVMQLSELMRYQLESSKKETVLLKEELEFIENYVLLEEKRLSKRCTVEFLIEGDFSGLRISPMLLIPFVENAIKHGAQSTNEQSRIDISATIKKAILNFDVVNSKPSMVVDTIRKGLGLENVKRRLKLLYPNSHKLEINDTENVYYVNLSVDLNVQQ
ncbi:sensor histidine kinase [Winogradskyella immobilis]|uniref:Histidine kinase n=1 Tax=Winogradskyella immobilis TaxID=2816852 RepID=A0ABS8EQB3_9FLAO|nr:histidine kinase [Winogradskyella immobilis]MCC1485066.1 histidine kinase [Winogradskyella immobilis]MCG0017158.1 histidine kinase [Winogradskyella immobilis]